MKNQPKLKRSVLTIDKKISALKRIQDGADLKSIAEEYGVGYSTVKEWKSKQAIFIEFASKTESNKNINKRCTLKKSKFDKLDEALWIWFCQERRRNTPLDGPIVKEKAKFFYKLLYCDDNFMASEGWFYAWKKRHGIRYISVSGEKLCGNLEAVADFRKEFLKIVEDENLTPEQIYNFDETGINWKRLPAKTLVTNDEKSASGYKLNKERITVGLCSNASGTHKLPPFMIGKYEKPRAFKNLNLKSLPVYYTHQRSAWMNCFLFKTWIENEFAPKVKIYLTTLNLPMKAVLVLDNAPTHYINTEIDGLKILFLPPNVTSLVQPMDQGVIAALKRKYRRRFMGQLLDNMELKNISLLNAVKSVNIKDVIYFIASSYEEISSDTLVKSWRKLWPEIENLIRTKENNEDTVIDKNEEKTILEGVRKIVSAEDVGDSAVYDWLNCDDVLGREHLTDDEILHGILVDKCPENNISTAIESINDNSVENYEDRKISHSAGRTALEITIKYIEQ